MRRRNSPQHEGEEELQMSTLMWEVRAVPGKVEQLLAFIRGAADPSAQVYRSAGPEPRVVVIDPSGRGIADVPAELVARPPHAWPFELVTD
jgi:hypothetical protein